MNVVFEEQAPIAHSSTSRGIVAWMLRNNIANTASHAQTMLLVLVVILLSISLLLAKSAMSHDEIDTHKGLKNTFENAVIR